MNTSTESFLLSSCKDAFADEIARSRIELCFSSIAPTCLEDIRLVNSEGLSRIFPRGGTYVSRPIKWTSAVRALVLFLIRNRIAALRNEDPYLLAGGAHSPAATLDYAITKQPRWLKQSFGCNEAGLCNVRRLIKRVNSERKGGGEVILSLANASLASQMRIYWGTLEISDIPTLTSIVESISAKRLSEQGKNVLREGPPQSDGVSLDADYSRIVLESKNYAAAVKKLCSRYSGLGERALTLECHLDIVVLNQEGDARITRNYIIANVGKTPKSLLRDRLCLENPRTSVKAVSYLQSTGLEIPSQFVVDTPHKKELELSIYPAIEPGGVCAYSVEYSVTQIFRHNSFWFSRVSPGCVRQSLSVQLNNVSKLERFHTMVELPNGDICDGVPWATTHNAANAVRLDWEFQSPIANSIVKTFWGT